MRKSLLILALLLSACATRQDCYNCMSKDFLSRGNAWIDEPVHVRLTVDVWIVPSYLYMRVPSKREKSGEAWTDGRDYAITVLGRTDGSTIFVDPATLGHELQHIINWRDSRVEDPDRK